MAKDEKLVEAIDECREAFKVNFGDGNGFTRVEYELAWSAWKIAWEAALATLLCHNCEGTGKGATVTATGLHEHSCADCNGTGKWKGGGS